VKPVVLRPDAELDTRAAAVWYEQEESGLGDEFGSAVAQTLSRIAALPAQFPRVAPRLQRALLHRFPYAVYFVDEPLRIVVIGIFHERRSPATWRRRLLKSEAG
jgi:plasmid stabilization system protein ParE